MGLTRTLTVTIIKEAVKRRFVLQKSKSESYLHILIKLLSYIYFWEEDLDIEPNIKYNKYKPDLIRLDPSINPKLIDKEIGKWVECKNVKLKKLDQLARYLNAEIFWFHSLHHLDKVLHTKIGKKYKRLNQISIIGISLEDIDVFLHSLQSNLSNWRIEMDFTFEKEVRENRELIMELKIRTERQSFPVKCQYWRYSTI